MNMYLGTIYVSPKFRPNRTVSSQEVSTMALAISSCYLFITTNSCTWLSVSIYSFVICSMPFRNESRRQEKTHNTTGNGVSFVFVPPYPFIIREVLGCWFVTQDGCNPNRPVLLLVPLQGFQLLEFGQTLWFSNSSLFWAFFADIMRAAAWGLVGPPPEKCWYQMSLEAISWHLSRNWNI
jgi:hypothetical protein